MQPLHRAKRRVQRDFRGSEQTLHMMKEHPVETEIKACDKRTRPPPAPDASCKWRPAAQ